MHKLQKHWANSVQANCDRRWSSCPSSSLSLEEVVVYLHHRVCDQASSWSSSCGWTEELYSRKSSWLVIEVTYWDPHNWLVMYLGIVHQKGELSLQNKSKSSCYLFLSLGFPIRKQIIVLFIFHYIINLLVICLCYHVFAW